MSKPLIKLVQPIPNVKCYCLHVGEATLVVRLGTIVAVTYQDPDTKEMYKKCTIGNARHQTYLKQILGESYMELYSPVTPADLTSIVNAIVGKEALRQFTGE